MDAGEKGIKMAEEVLGKSVNVLKQERTTAKRNLTRLANLISRGAGNMLQSELKEEVAKFADRFTSLLDANEDFRIGLEAELKKDDPEGELEKQQEDEIQATIKEAEGKMEEIKDIVQTNLWGRYGKTELKAAIAEAEDAINRAGNVAVESNNMEGYDVHLTLLNETMSTTIHTMAVWEKWIPPQVKDGMDDGLKQLKAAHYKLKLRKAESTSRRLADQGTSGRPGQPTPPIVRIKPTSLPVFYGSKRDFHRWKKDWENLQKQGEPTGSPEVRKIQLLESVSESSAKELRLSTYTTATDIFRVLENRYGNKSTITVEILEALDKMPQVKGNQPRRVIDLIQAVERALADLTELGNSGAISNPLVIKSIESYQIS